MAQIAVERRGGIPWWVWLIVALVVIGIIWWIAAAGNGHSAAVTSPRTGEASRADTTGAAAGMTDLSSLYNRSDAAAVVGQRVDSEPVLVLSVTGDRTFWAGQDAGRQVLVVLNQQPTPNQPATEGRYDVNPGQTVRIHGTVERFPGFDAARQQWNVDPKLRSEFDKQAVYIKADRLDIVTRP